MDAQDAMKADADYAALFREQELLNARFLQQLSTMTREQQDAVMDDCGLLIELHLRTLKYVLERKMEGESE